MQDKGTCVGGDILNGGKPVQIKKITKEPRVTLWQIHPSTIRRVTSTTHQNPTPPSIIAALVDGEVCVHNPTSEGHIQA